MPVTLRRIGGSSWCDGERCFDGGEWSDNRWCVGGLWAGLHHLLGSFHDTCFSLQDLIRQVLLTCSAECGGACITGGVGATALLNINPTPKQIARSTSVEAMNDIALVIDCTVDVGFFFK